MKSGASSFSSEVETDVNLRFASEVKWCVNATFAIRRERSMWKFGDLVLDVPAHRPKKAHTDEGFSGTERQRNYARKLRRAEGGKIDAGVKFDQRRQIGTGS